MRKEDMGRRLDAFEMWTWRRMEKISWTEHKTNEEALEAIGEERSIIHVHTQKSQTKEVDRTHCKRRITVKNCNLRKMLGKISRGRQRQMMLDWMTAEGYRWLKEETQDRDE